MAEVDLKRLTNDNDDADEDRPNKRKKITGSTAAAATTTGETEDTASSKPKKEESEVAEIDNVHIMQEILLYRNRKGECPSKSADDFQSFCHLYIHRGVGNAEGWANKMNEMKNKFNSASAPTDDVDKQEFQLWNKIWGNDQDQDQPKGDDDDA